LCRYHQKENLIDIIRLLIENGIDVKFKDNDGDNALTLLVQNYELQNLIEIMQLLIHHQCDVPPEKLAIFKEEYHKENRNEILQLLDQNV
jgi:ankyrin repeat protein